MYQWCKKHNEFQGISMKREHKQSTSDIFIFSIDHTLRWCFRYVRLNETHINFVHFLFTFAMRLLENLKSPTLLTGRSCWTAAIQYLGHALRVGSARTQVSKRNIPQKHLLGSKPSQQGQAVGPRAEGCSREHKASPPGMLKKPWSGPYRQWPLLDVRNILWQTEPTCLRGEGGAGGQGQTYCSAWTAPVSLHHK